jgi:leucyl aminopeptidase (aminopeptidase T)
VASDLSAASEAAVRRLGVNGVDSVAVVYNEQQRSIAEALAAAARRQARVVSMLEFPAASRDGEEPPGEVAEAMLAADVVLAPTSRSLSQTGARRAATARGVRIASLPTITEEIFVRGVLVDYAELERTSAALATRLTVASTARVTSVAGTDITLSLQGRSGHSDDGNLYPRGAFGNLPAGEGYVSPVETVGDGTIVIDGSLAGYGLLPSPVRITVEDGRAVAAETDVGQWLLETLDSGGEHGRSLAELGIGTNPSAVLTGNVLEDEKVIGTIHLAFGTSAGLGGVNVAGVHLDGVLLRPTLVLDEECVLDQGHLLAL